MAEAFTEHLRLSIPNSDFAVLVWMFCIPIGSIAWIPSKHSLLDNSLEDGDSPCDPVLPPQSTSLNYC